MSLHSGAQRYVVVHIPDWQTASLTLAVPPGSSAAIVARGRVCYANLAARKDGVQVGMRVSSAQILSPHMLVVAQDAQGDAARFEAVIRAVETQVARVYAIRPGLAWALVGGAARWHGGEPAVAEAIIDAVSEHVGLECQVGIATGVLPAILAAQRGDIVPAQGGGDYVAPVALSRVLACVPQWESEFRLLLRELSVLGIYTCGQLVHADRVHYQARFGLAFERLYVLAAGGDVFLPRAQRREYDIRAHYDCDDAQISADHLLIPMTHLAAEVTVKMAQARVRGRSMVTVIGTVDGHKHRREWGGVSADKSDVIVRRLRWHMQSWAGQGVGASGVLCADGVPDDEAGVAHLGGGVAFVEVRVRDCESADPDTPLWGVRKENEALERSVERIHSLLGEDAALGLHRRGAFDPRGSVCALPWGARPEGLPPREGEWVGSVSEPPEVLCVPPIPVALTVYAGDSDAPAGSQGGVMSVSEGKGKRDAEKVAGAQIIAFPGMKVAEEESEAVLISPRGTLNTVSARLELLRDPMMDALAHWSTQQLYRVDFIEPVWNIRGRWWLPARQQGADRRRSYVRGRCVDGTELLFVSYGKHWWIEGVYDRLSD